MMGGLMKSRKIMMIVANYELLLSIGGCSVKHKDDTKQGKNDCCFVNEDLKEDRKYKKKQLDYLKRTRTEIVDFVTQNSKSNPFKYIGMKLSGAWQEMEHLKSGDEMILILVDLIKSWI